MNCSMPVTQRRQLPPCCRCRTYHRHTTQRASTLTAHAAFQLVGQVGLFSSAGLLAATQATAVPTDAAAQAAGHSANFIAGIAAADEAVTVVAADNCNAGWLCSVPPPAAVAVGILAVAAVAWKLLGSSGPSRPSSPVFLVQPNQVGDITLPTMAMYCGKDPFRQTLVAIQGQVYDVSKARNTLFAPGRPLHAYAGREISRALAKASLLPEDCSDNLQDLSPEELARLDEEAAEYRKQYTPVGQVVPLRQMTLEELKQYDGREPEKPMYLAIKGRVYDITTGKMYYGPNGIYPFAGREVARAFALNSLKDTDCTSDLEGITRGDLNNLAEWEAKFNYKYPIIGVISELEASHSAASQKDTASQSSMTAI